MILRAIYCSTQFMRSSVQVLCIVFGCPGKTSQGRKYLQFFSTQPNRPQEYHNWNILNLGIYILSCAPADTIDWRWQ